MKSRQRLVGRSMWVAYLAVGFALSAAPVVAQEAPASSPAAGSESSKTDSPAGELPVSLDRIRAGLRHQAAESILKRVEIPPDFRIQILEQQRINDMLSKLDFKHLSGPVPPGGLYGYDQQRRLFNPVDHPLVQPYAAFSGGELITIAIENLIAKYLGGRLVDSVSSAERAAAERAARQEVDKAIVEYCAARPDRYDIQLCTSPPADR